MDFNKLEKILAKEPAFRLKQTKQALFCDLIDDWQQASTLPADLRRKLATGFPLEIKAELFEAKDKKTVKALIALKDGLGVETVLMRHGSSAIDFSLSANPAFTKVSAGKHSIPVPLHGTPAFTQNQPRQTKNAGVRNTICVSSQIGCPLGCAFCATGQMGFKRNLKTHEIIEQVLFFARYLKKGEQKITSVVFMGMGEPFLNYNNVLTAIKILNDKNGFNT